MANSLKDVIENTKKIYMTDSALNTLLDFERIIDELDVYTFDHWKAGELVAEFQWLTASESELVALTPEKLQDIRLEIADVEIYLLRLADVLEIDVASAVREKLAINESRF